MSVLVYCLIKRKFYCLTDYNVFKSSSGGSLDSYNDKNDRRDSAAEEIPKERYVLSLFLPQKDSTLCMSF